MTIHRHPVRVYYEDTDAGGIVYHASFIRFAERARTEMLREMGYKNSDLHKRDGLRFVVRHIDASYETPCFLDDMLELHTHVLEIRNSSFVLRQTVLRDQNHVCVLNVTLVTINENGKAVRLPQNVRQDFKEYLA